ncbi:6564_t:CDS:1 [Paraglomus occultum]|uniref:6564_t:CDS:1 n=1 Tax=Paraglomus occultum TaxID=144539 RepID=A0A9N9AEZ0_9GLOM|nr:6564_t:CDS:1 [Paraglomus occultum]
MLIFPTPLCHSTDTLTSHERNLLDNPPYALSMSLNSLTNPGRRQNENQNSKFPRPSNSWIIFRTNFASRLRSQYPNALYKVQDVSRLASMEWNSLPILVKKYFDILAKLALQRHKKTYLGYIYKPNRMKQNKKKNWTFKEVNRAKFIEREIDNNNKQEEAGKQMDNSTQPDKLQTLDDYTQLNVSNQYEQLQTLDKYTLLSNYVQRNEYEHPQAPSAYALSSDYVQQNGHENQTSGKYVLLENLNKYEQLPALDIHFPSNEFVRFIEYAQSDYGHSLERDQLNGCEYINEFDGCILSGEPFQYNEYDQRNRCALSNEYYKLVYVNEQQHLLDEIGLHNGEYDMHNNEYYDIFI